MGPFLDHVACGHKYPPSVTSSASSSLWAMGLAILAACTAGSARAANPPPATRGPVKVEAVFAAFTVNLTRFVSWPASSFTAPGTPLIIGTFPRDPINEELDEAVAGEIVNGHPLQTMRLASLNDVTRCHVIFVSHTNNGRQAAVLERCAHRPILVIGDADNFLELGGHVRYVVEPPHTRLRISVDNLRASGLECRAQLLRLAAAP